MMLAYSMHIVMFITGNDIWAHNQHDKLQYTHERMSKNFSIEHTSNTFQYTIKVQYILGYSVTTNFVFISHSLYPINGKPSKYLDKIKHQMPIKQHIKNPSNYPILMRVITLTLSISHILKYKYYSNSNDVRTKYNECHSIEPRSNVSENPQQKSKLLTNKQNLIHKEDEGI
jgi:hypothetical protein